MFYKDINNIIFDYLSINDKYSFFMFHKNENNDSVTHYEIFFNSITNEEWNNILTDEENLNEDLIEKYISRISKYVLSRKQLTPNFILKNFKHLCLTTLLYFNQLPLYLLEHYYDLFLNYDRNSRIFIFLQKNVTENFLIKHEKDILFAYLKLKDPSDFFLYKYRNKIHWSNIIFTDITRYEDYKEYIDWEALSYSDILTNEFIDMYKKYLNMEICNFVTRKY
jgi:hypothetical protein